MLSLEAEVRLSVHISTVLRVTCQILNIRHMKRVRGQLWGMKMRSRLLLQFPDTRICQASNFYYTYLSVLYTEILTKMYWDNNS